MKVIDYKREYLHRAISASVVDLMHIRHEMVEAMCEDRDIVLTINGIQEFIEFCEEYEGHRMRQWRAEREIRRRIRRARA